jgi:hypothetical protein
VKSAEGERLRISAPLHLHRVDPPTCADDQIIGNPSIWVSYTNPLQTPVTQRVQHSGGSEPMLREKAA